MALNLELRLVERDRHCRLLEQLVREEAVPDLHPLGRRLLGKQRHELRQRDGARLRELVEDGVESEEVIPVRVGDVDLGQVLPVVANQSASSCDSPFVAAPAAMKMHLR
jgi:hypothetical protein